MVLETGDDAFDYNMHLLSDIYNMWAGNIFGNSPAGARFVCAEVSIFCWRYGQYEQAYSLTSGGSALTISGGFDNRKQVLAYMYSRWNDVLLLE
jgi:hypothetical protein